MTVMVVGDAMARPLAEALDRARTICRRWNLSGRAGRVWAAVKAKLKEQLPSVLDRQGRGVGAWWQRFATGPDAGPRFTPSSRAVLGDDRRPVAPGSGLVGRLARHGHMPLGYYKDASKTAATFVPTRRRALGDPRRSRTLEADGTISLLGHGSGCINSGGEKMYPEEVEAAIKIHPDVFDAIVVGVPDARFIERVAAMVPPRTGRLATLEDVAEHCRRGSPATRCHASSSSSTRSSARPPGRPTTAGRSSSSRPSRRRDRRRDRAPERRDDAGVPLHPHHGPGHRTVPHRRARRSHPRQPVRRSRALPPLEYDPDTGASLDPEFVEVGPGGTVRSWTWVAIRPRSTRSPSVRVALIKLDGADTPIVHAVDAGSIERCRRTCASGAVPRRARGAITDVYFVPEADAQKQDITAGEEPVTITEHLYRWIREPMYPHLPGSRAACSKAASSASAPDERQGVRPGPRLRQPRARAADRGRRGRRRRPWHRHSFTVITPVQYYGQKETEPYIRASILLDGADQPIIGVDIRDIPRGVPGRHARQARSGSRQPSDVIDLDNRFGGVWEDVIERWEPTGEPDVDPRAVQDALVTTDARDIADLAVSQTPSYRRSTTPSPS